MTAIEPEGDLEPDRAKGYLILMRYDRRVILFRLATFPAVVGTFLSKTMAASSNVIDDLSLEAPLSALGTPWQLFTDQVMGGASNGRMAREIVSGRPAIRMRGDVKLENNGGFVQIAIDLTPDGRAIDASAWQGIELDVFGNGEDYSLHLRTEDLTRPWQSYRQTFRADQSWQTLKFRFTDSVPYRTDTPLNITRLRRIGIVAIGRAFSADLAIGGIRFMP